MSAFNTFGGSLRGSYTDSSFLFQLPFGSQSHWIQPWRAYLETIPASSLLKGLGMGLPLDQPNPEPLIQMLSSSGIQTLRIEMNWGKLEFQTDSLIDSNHKFRIILEACKNLNIRPTILLNFHQGAPCPMRNLNPITTLAADSGANKITLDNVANIVIGKTGVNNLTGYWAAEGLVTELSGNTITISKPLRKAIPKGGTVSMSTLKYRPFSVPGSPDYNETMVGWKKYLSVVDTFVTHALGPTLSSDKGFDLEIYNELTFGTEFLYINHYYKSAPYTYNETQIWGLLVDSTANFVNRNANDYSGVRITNGFANTIPWPASSHMPARINAISKHPYHGRNTYPLDNAKGTNIDAQGMPTSEIPTYTSLFPEYYATAIQTESIVRDMGPLTNEFYGTPRGRFARTANPCWVWITEVGIAPNEDGITDTTKALLLKAKALLRYYSFYLNKGVQNLQIFAATGGDLYLGILLDKFVSYAHDHPSYPANDSAYRSPALQGLRNFTKQFKEGLDETLTLEQCRKLTVTSITDTHDHFQFASKGTLALPNLYDRDVFAFLPFQINAGKFVIPYYVMTRDIAKDLNPEEFTLEIKGIRGKEATVSCYDPLHNLAIPLTVISASDSTIKLSLTTSDYPYLLSIQEANNSIGIFRKNTTPSKMKDEKVWLKLLPGQRTILLPLGTKDARFYNVTGVELFRFSRNNSNQRTVAIPKSIEASSLLMQYTVER